MGVANGQSDGDIERQWADCHGRILGVLREQGYGDLGVGFARDYMEWAGHVSVAVSDPTCQDPASALSYCLGAALDELTQKTWEDPHQLKLMEDLILPNLFAFHRNATGGRDIPDAHVHASPLWGWWTVARAHVQQLLDDAPIPARAFSKARSEIEKWVALASDSIEADRNLDWYLDPDSLDTSASRAAAVVRAFPDALPHLHSIFATLGTLSAATREGDRVKDRSALLSFTPTGVPDTAQSALARLREAAVDPIQYPPPWDPTRGAGGTGGGGPPLPTVTPQAAKQLRRLIENALREWDALVEWFLGVIRRHLPDESDASPLVGATFENRLLAWANDVRQLIAEQRWSDLRYSYGTVGLSYLKECARVAIAHEPAMLDGWYQLFDQINRFDDNQVQPLLSWVDQSENAPILRDGRAATADQGTGQGRPDVAPNTPLFPHVMRKNGYRPIRRSPLTPPS